MQVEPTAAGSTLQDFSIPTSQRTNGTDLTQQDFLKVMVEQLKNQNPLDPQNGDQFFAQIVQFQTLDAMQQISKELQALTDVGGLANASALIGRTVKASIDPGPDPQTGMPRSPQVITGVVDSVTFQNGSPVVHVGNQSIPASKVVEVS